MPRIKPLTENARKDRAFQEQLVGKMKADKVTYQQLAEILGVSIQTVYRRRDEPETLTLRERRILQRVFPDIVIE